MDYLYVSM